MRSYEGSEPYIFLSYAHKNTDVVMPIFQGLYEQGFRIWYDAGTEPGTEWPEYIAGHLSGANCCICFLTKAFLGSYNCRQELNFAMMKDIPILVIYMEDVKLTAGMEMRLGLTQAMFRSRHATEESFLQALYDAKILSACGNSSCTDGSDVERKSTAVLNKGMVTGKTGTPSEQAPKPKESNRYSVGLAFKKLNDGTYAVTGMGTCQDKKLKIPPKTPAGGRVKAIRSEAFKDRMDLTSVVIPDGVETIESWAFAGCVNMETISMPCSMDTIGYSAFKGCSGLSSVIIPIGVRKVYLHAFQDCSKITVYCEHASQPSAWDQNWKPSNRPVIWNYKPE